MISVYCWTPANKCGHWLKPEELLSRAAELRGKEVVVWIDLDNPTEDEETLVCKQFFPVHTLTLEDITRLRRLKDAPHFPKVEEFPDYLFVVTNPLIDGFVVAAREHRNNMSAQDRATTQLSAVLTETILITHHYEPVSAVRELRRFLTKHEAQAERGPDYLFHLVLDAMVDQYVPVLDHLDNALDEIENRVFSRPTQKLLLRLLHLKRRIVVLRKTLIYEREVLARLARGEFALIEAREMVYYRNVYDHLVRFTELMEASRELVTDLMQTHLAAASNKLNEIMKVLTMISTVILPMTLIAGIYGMNFEQNVFPGFQSTMGFMTALGMMALTGVAAFAYFRWKKWI